MIIEFQTEPLIVEVPDMVTGSTVIKRKAEFKALLYEPQQKKIVIRFSETFYANENETYGDQLDFPAKELELYCSNTNFVDVSTGKKLASYEYDLVTGELNPELVDVGYAKQFDYWYYIAANNPVILHDAIRLNILANYDL